MKRIIKKFICLVIILIMSIDSIAAVVSDNDGAAFITKAEFDSLKNNFQSQIDQFNTSIDSKIDSAIAGYLAGIKAAKTIDLYLDSKCLYHFPIVMDAYDYWNDPTTAYYSISTPDFDRKNYIMYTDDNSSVTYAQPDSSTLEPFVIPMNPSGGYSQMASLFLDHFQTSGCDGFVNIVGLIDGTRTIGSTTYSVRERLNAGYGNDIIRYESYRGLYKQTSGGHSIESETTTSCRTYHYFDVAGWNAGTLSGGVATFNYSDSNRGEWNSTGLRMTRMGNGHPDLGIQSASSFGTTYGSYVNFRNTLTCGWFNYSSIDYSPSDVSSSVFNWIEAGKVNRVYAKNANVPAERQGHWRLTPQKGTTASTRFRELVIKPNGDKFFMGFTTKDSGAILKAKPWYSFQYFLIPYWTAKDNSSIMPGNSDDFSKLPARLVHYNDSKGKTHFLDEGMFLQTFEKDGDVNIKLSFSGTGNPSINIYFSKQPFDSMHSSADYLNVTVKNVEYTSGYTLNLASAKEVEFKIKDIKADDDLYLYWEPTVPKTLCSLDEIINFNIETDK